MIPSQIHSTNEAVPQRGPLMTLRIIVAALALGVASYGAFVVAQNIGKPQVLAARLDSLNVILLALGLVTLLLGIFVPYVVFSSSRGSLPQVPAELAKTPQQARLVAIQLRIQTATIIGCALFEGGAFANLFGYSQSRELLHLVLAGVLLLGICAHFPTTGAYERRIDDELRRQNEEEAFKQAP